MMTMMMMMMNLFVLGVSNAQLQLFGPCQFIEVGEALVIARVQGNSRKLKHEHFEAIGILEPRQ